MHNISDQDSKSTIHWLSYRTGGYKKQRHGQVLNITVFSTAMNRIFIKTIPWGDAEGRCWGISVEIY